MQFKAMFLHENVSIFVPAGGRARARARANAMTGNWPKTFEHIS